MNFIQTHLARFATGKAQRRKLLLLIWLTASILTGGCTLPIISDNSSNGPAVIEKAEVLIAAHLWSPLPEGDRLDLVVVDEVTGLPYHQERIEMTAMPDGRYFAIYNAPIGTLLTFTFHKVNADGSRIPEVGADWQPIRYRMFYVESPSMVTESIAGWEDQLPDRSHIGQITGTVVTTEFEEPLTDILVSAGGVQTTTDAQGRFTLYPVVRGTNNLIAISMTGSYQPAQDQAQVRIDKITPAELKMSPTAFRKVTFNVQVPPDTISGAPIRIAGNLSQLGNTFTELGGGMSGDTKQMPVLSPLKEGWFTATMLLPVGIDVRYKYTLGDGFWNAEHGLDQGFITHQLILPADSGEVIIQDRVATWRSSNTETIWFRATVPDYTPAQEAIGIQFNIADWMPALPMFKVQDNTWAFPLISPHNFSGAIPYRYCRNTPCTGNSQVGVESLVEQRVSTTVYPEVQLKNDTVSGWIYLAAPTETDLSFANLPSRDSSFTVGLGLTPYHNPTWQPYITGALQAAALPYNHVIFSPAWESAPQPGPRLLQISLVQTPRWNEMIAEIETAHENGLAVSLYPQVLFPGTPVQWWDSLPTAEEHTWQQWLGEYREMVYQYADLAAQTDTETLILGGEWLLPAVPVGDNFSRYSQPGNIESLWKETIQGVRDHYPGQVGWMVTAEMAEEPPDFLGSVDVLFFQWDLPLEDGLSQEEMIDEAGAQLDELAEPLAAELDKPLILVIAVPSVQGYSQECIPSPNDEGGCIDVSALRLGPSVENPASSDIQQQAKHYHAILSAAAERDWIQGVISQGYFPALALHDSSASIHGKPAETLLHDWSNLVLGN